MILPSVLADRLDKVRALLVDARRIGEWARPHVGLAKQRALRHTEHRLEAEVAYLGDLLEAAGNVVSDERAQSVRIEPAI